MTPFALPYVVALILAAALLGSTRPRFTETRADPAPSPATCRAHAYQGQTFRMGRFLACLGYREP